MAAKITLIDYGAGNLPSVERALRRLGRETERVNESSAIERASILVLPGVGHFSALARVLADRKLLNPIRSAIQKGTPFLGICLGMQALYESSDEAPGQPGLGLLPGTVGALQGNVKIPHMGWDRIRRTKESPLLIGIPDDAYFYFANSYAASRVDETTVAMCDYGQPFVVVAEKDNMMAIQFHPEKSGETGARLLQNFLAIARR